VKQHKLRKLIAWLSDKEGKGMEFISLYIPREKSIGDIIAILTLVTKVVNNQTILLKNEEIE
jgi:peptide subunit release factor 1 (eRF1)